MVRVTEDGSWYKLENMTFWPLLWRQTGEQERMFNFVLQQQWSGYVIIFDQGDRKSSLNSETWNNFWKKVFGM
jgi:hypothetical protein